MPLSRQFLDHSRDLHLEKKVYEHIDQHYGEKMTNSAVKSGAGLGVLGGLAGGIAAVARGNRAVATMAGIGLGIGASAGVLGSALSYKDDVNMLNSAKKDLRDRTSRFYGTTPSEIKSLALSQKSNKAMNALSTGVMSGASAAAGYKLGGRMGGRGAVAGAIAGGLAAPMVSRFLGREKVAAVRGSGMLLAGALGATGLAAGIGAKAKKSVEGAVVARRQRENDFMAEINR